VVTVNYGIAGGTLDSSRLLEAALPRLLTTLERAERAARLRQGFVPYVIAAAPGKALAERN
jgi:hypothetical protein